jgi:2-polyprenyl-6-methoxyphenol hydroxylase-like FAD-dependent oxidoreductase
LSAGPRTAIVVGGSLGGLFAANLLLRAGWDVHVYERAGEPLSGRGAGIVTHDSLFRALERCGVAIDASLGCEASRSRPTARWSNAWRCPRC